jgi:spore coat polysaccharide biosynthesis protein SpsF (cytidylyltransferase family)
VLKNIAIIQARMSSTRLPGKVLLPLSGQPVLEHVVKRVRQCKFVDKVVVATTEHNSDDLIENWCKKNNVEYYRGSLEDVLDRFYKVAKLYKAENILRITADCPAIDSGIIDEIIEKYHEGNFDFYGLSGEFPDGLDCTMFSFNALETAWKNSKLQSEREHVGPYIVNHPELFVIGGYKKFQKLEHIRLTLDDPRDYELLSIIFNKLYESDHFFGIQSILNLLESNPDLLEINSKIIRNEGYLKSILNDIKVNN